MLRSSPCPLLGVVMQHAEESAHLCVNRQMLVKAPHINLHALGRLDERLAAHLDGLAVAGEFGSKLAMDALQTPGSGETFSATVRALEDRDPVALERLLAFAQVQPQVRRGLVAAFGWVSAATLRGITQKLLESTSAFRRQVGLAACAMHRVDPGAAAMAALHDDDAALRIRALRVIADRGRVDLLPACAKAMQDADARCADTAMRTTVLLGDRGASVSTLHDRAAAPGSGRHEALGLLLKLLAPERAQELLKALSQEPAELPMLTWALGVAGNPQHVPWLIRQMHDPKLARLAGESFTMITGLDLAKLDLERQPADSGSSEEPADEDVAMGEDDDLPWPDPERITAWWQANGQRFAPGTRYFMGQQPSLEHCVSVLRSGFQRQRSAAATYMCLLRPGTPLFNTAAPAWRQERWLKAMEV